VYLPCDVVEQMGRVRVTEEYHANWLDHVLTCLEN